MYSIVLLTAMSTSPEMPEFCCKTSGCFTCYSGSSCGSGCFCGKGGGYSSGCFCGKGGGCGFCGFCCGKGGYGSAYTGGGYGAYPVGGYIAGAHQFSIGTHAEVVVRLPADAKLYANGQATDQAGDQRVFQTPDLAVGQDFKYVLKIQLDVNGETRTATKQVTVRAGHRTVVDFTERASSAVVVNLPAKARLMVDGVDTGVTGGKNTLHTPELTKGQPYSYTFRAEIDRDGQIEVVNQEVKFKGGEPITVDFTDSATRTVSTK